MLTLDCDDVMPRAREIFEAICPGEEFLPRMPHPDDEVDGDEYGGTDQQQEVAAEVTEIIDAPASTSVEGEQPQQPAEDADAAAPTPAAQPSAEQATTTTE